MIIQERNRNTESKPFISLSRKAFIFWSCFVMGLCAFFFFAGTLVGRGQIQVDLGQNRLFNEIMGLSETAPPEEQKTEPAGETLNDKTDFDFYNNLNAKNPEKDIEPTIKPSNKPKVKQVVKKKLSIVKPEEVEQADSGSAGKEEPLSNTGKKDIEAQGIVIEKPKTETVPFTMKTSSEKPKTETADKTVKETLKKESAEKAKTEQKEKAETVDKAKADQKTKTETADKAKADQKTKTETVDKTKADQKTKTETADKSKADQKSKNETADKTKPSDKTKTETKTDNAPKKFSLQVAALKNQADAETMVKKLKGLGFSAHTVKTENGDTWYKVRVGTFKDRTEADNTIAKLKTKGFDAFVISQ
jgi:cell division septation protein DedD